MLLLKQVTYVLSLASSIYTTASPLLVPFHCSVTELGGRERVLTATLTDVRVPCNCQPHGKNSRAPLAMRLSSRLEVCVLVPLVLPLMLLQTPASDASLMYMWHRVFVSPAMINSSKNDSLSHHERAKQTLLCSNSCLLRGWCQVWCRSSPSLCTFYSAVVMPTYQQDDLTEDTLSCYTRRPKDFATGAKVIGGVTVHGTVVDTLVDGIYDVQISSCFKTKKAEGYQWFLLDLGAPRIFSHVRLRAQPTSLASKMFSDIEVRVGETPVNGPENFTLYRSFGKFVGPGQKDQEVDLVSHRPVQARFVSVQMLMGGQHFQVCHVEVF